MAAVSTASFVSASTQSKRRSTVNGKITFRYSLRSYGLRSRCSNPDRIALAIALVGEVALVRDPIRAPVPRRLDHLTGQRGSTCRISHLLHLNLCTWLCPASSGLKAKRGSPSRTVISMPDVCSCHQFLAALARSGPVQRPVELRRLVIESSCSWWLLWPLETVFGSP